ncbi:MAG: tRNA (adenosine(37)-N6)-dimethylallyltransferase MiaA [Cellvibrionaceae bacterium]
MKKPPVIFLMGPTAAGKTDLAISLTEKIPVDVISVDSTMVYRELDIGSAKPTREELAKAPHQLVDIRDPSDPYSASEFCDDAMAAIQASHEKNRIPLLVGGTMMYFNVLLKGMAEMPSADVEIRMEIEAIAKEEGWPALHEQLRKVDPETAASLHPNHSQRISRALEVFKLTGKTMSQLRNEQHESPKSKHDSFLNRFSVGQFAVGPRNRAVLHDRIKKRFHTMIESGFEQEVIGLRSRGDLHADLPAVRAVGYRQMWEYLDGETSYEEMIEKGIAATRQLAKRQLTWLRKWESLQWLYTEDESGREINLPDICNLTLNYLKQTTI